MVFLLRVFSFLYILSQPQEPLVHSNVKVSGNRVCREIVILPLSIFGWRAPYHCLASDRQALTSWSRELLLVLAVGMVG